MFTCNVHDAENAISQTEENHFRLAGVQKNDLLTI